MKFALACQLAIIAKKNSRCPYYSLKELPYGSGITVLDQVIRRVKRSKRIDEVIVATTTNIQDKAIVNIAEKENVGSFRGSEDDVLSRYYHVMKQSNGSNMCAIVIKAFPTKQRNCLKL